jgi:hypothetical protein
VWLEPGDNLREWWEESGIQPQDDHFELGRVWIEPGDNLRH